MAAPLSEAPAARRAALEAERDRGTREWAEHSCRSLLGTTDRLLMVRSLVRLTVGRPPLSARAAISRAAPLRPQVTGPGAEGGATRIYTVTVVRRAPLDHSRLEALEIFGVPKADTSSAVLSSAAREPAVSAVMPGGRRLAGFRTNDADDNTVPRAGGSRRSVLQAPPAAGTPAAAKPPPPSPLPPSTSPWVSAGVGPPSAVPAAPLELSPVPEFASDILSYTVELPFDVGAVRFVRERPCVADPAATPACCAAGPCPLVVGPRAAATRQIFSCAHGAPRAGLPQRDIGLSSSLLLLPLGPPAPGADAQEPSRRRREGGWLLCVQWHAVARRARG